MSTPTAANGSHHGSPQRTTRPLGERTLFRHPSTPARAPPRPGPSPVGFRPAAQVGRPGPMRAAPAWRPARRPVLVGPGPSPDGFRLAAPARRPRRDAGSLGWRPLFWGAQVRCPMGRGGDAGRGDHVRPGCGGGLPRHRLRAVGRAYRRRFPSRAQSSAGGRPVGCGPRGGSGSGSPLGSAPPSDRLPRAAPAWRQRGAGRPGRPATAPAPVTWRGGRTPPPPPGAAPAAPGPSRRPRPSRRTRPGTGPAPASGRRRGRARAR